MSFSRDFRIKNYTQIWEFLTLVFNSLEIRPENWFLRSSDTLVFATCAIAQCWIRLDFDSQFNLNYHERLILSIAFEE